MPQFGYRSLRVMDARQGRSFQTTYYKQSPEQYLRTQQHIDALLVLWGTEALANPEVFEVFTRPQKRFPRRESTGYYSYLDIIADLHEQMNSGKDIPSGMLGRWNRAFADTEFDIDMVSEDQLADTTTYRVLFGEVT